MKNLFSPRKKNIVKISENLSEELCHNCTSSLYLSTHRRLCKANPTKKNYDAKSKSCVSGAINKKKKVIKKPVKKKKPTKKKKVAKKVSKKR